MKLRAWGGHRSGVHTSFWHWERLNRKNISLGVLPERFEDMALNLWGVWFFYLVFLHDRWELLLWSYWRCLVVHFCFWINFPFKGGLKYAYLLSTLKLLLRPDWSIVWISGDFYILSCASTEVVLCCTEAKIYMLWPPCSLKLNYWSFMAHPCLSEPIFKLFVGLVGGSERLWTLVA